MNVRNLIPWNRGKALAPSRYEDEASGLLSLHRDMNRLFDDFFRGFDLPIGMSPSSGAWPQIDMSESDKEIKVTAELPGLDEKNVELTVQDGVLTIRGEKRAETDGSFYRERWHGAFQRSLQLGADADPDKISASFRHGLLTVTIGKKPEAQSNKIRIPISV
jgi:HSP20 family protein